MKNRKGFTLLETLLAVVILSMGILLLTQSWSGSFLRIRKTQLNQDVAALLERKMNEIDLEFRGKPLDTIPEEKEDDFGAEYPQYKWKMISREFQMPNMSSILMQQEGGANDMLMMMIQQLTEHLSKTIKEVKVSVIYTGGKKPLEYSIVTYFVDYNKPLAIGGSTGAAPGGAGP
ncbi:MAG: type II secretion system protein [Bdellovibrionales bacterium]|nr:type II secretion system protein [Bdellovibrionales bacterium]